MASVQDLLQALLSGAPATGELQEQLPMFPFHSLDMPVPGPNFVAAATAMGANPAVTLDGRGSSKRVTAVAPQLDYLYRRALYDADFQLPVLVRGVWKQAQFVPGHLRADTTDDFNGGPRRARVMIVGKQPGREEVEARANFSGPSSECLFEALQQAGVTDSELDAWYLTSLVKFPQLDQQSDGLPQQWVKDCAPLLQQELRLARPDFVLLLGSHASKAVLGKWAAVTNLVGRVERLTFPVHMPGEPPQYHNAQVMACTHPAAVYRKPELFDAFADQLSLFVRLTQGAEIGAVETDIDHPAVYKERQLARIVDAIRADPARWLIAVDGEWHGEYPTEPGAYLRTIQFSSRHGEGVTVVLRHQGGAPAFKPTLSAAITQLRRLLLPDPTIGYKPRVGGHFLRADMPWLLHAGIDCRESYAAPDCETQARDSGGWDTSVMYHAVNEAASYKLEDIAARLTTVPRYDKKLTQWKEQWCKRNAKSSKDLEGYGDCPDWILHPTDGTPSYASYDPDATRRIAVRCMEPGGLLDQDWYGQASWRPYWVAHSSSLAFLEMELHGVRLDKTRVDKLTRLFMFARDRMLADFRSRINWPEFNPESPLQCQAFLFGDRYAYKQLPNGDRVAIRPPEAATLNLTPVKTTGKRSKMWEQVVSRGEERLFQPSTDKEVLGILGHSHPLAMQLRDLKFVAQALKFVLRPPDADTHGVAEMDEDGNLVYSRGLSSFVHVDGRVRTHFSQTKETGRASSYRPPLQNMSNRREDDFRRILGVVSDGGLVGDYTSIFPEALYEHPLRSVIAAQPGWALVDVDFTGAELAMLAWMAGDPVMIDHVRRNNLPEEHPEHYDIHSQQAVRAFKLACAPTKSGLKKAGFKGKRVAAKNVNFGVPYGRMAVAIARQCREEGEEVSVDEAQALIDMYFETYKRTVQFLAECRDRVTNQGWLSTYLGRRRRFFASRDRMVVGEQERQAQNFPIQGGVADAVSGALAELLKYRAERSDVQYRMLLQIHDAVVFEVPIPQLRAFVKDELDAAGNVVRPSVLRECMVNRVKIVPTDLDGRPLPDNGGPYHFGIDWGVQLNWGENLTPEQAEACGIPVDLI